MVILITGSNGQLGREMQRLAPAHPQHSYIFTDILVPEQSDFPIYPLDITDRNAVLSFAATQHIDLIVNCAAYTNVDKAEDDEQTALRINAQAVSNLADTGAKLIHISTDYVFSGDANIPYSENDPVAPNTAYGRTKLAGEQALAQRNAIIFRTAWLYSEFGNNFVKTMLRLGTSKSDIGVVFDQVGSPTYAFDLAQAIFTAINSNQWHSGIYHFTNEGVCSWYDFTIAIHSMHNAIISNPDQAIHCNVRPILSSEYQHHTPRPHYSVLDKSKFKHTFTPYIPYWTDALQRCLSNMLSHA